MFNKVILVGNLTGDVELRYIPSGTAVATIGLAVSRRFKDSAGMQKDEVCYVDVRFYGRTAEVANQYTRKGSKILVEGRLRLETWADQTGQKRSKHTIHGESIKMLDSRSSQNSPYSQDGYNSGEPNQQNQYQQNRPQESYNQNPNSGSGSKDNMNDNVPDIDIDEDEIPF